MAIQSLSEGVILVSLPDEAQLSEELQIVNKIVSGGNACDVIVDFSNAEIVTSVSLSNLLILRGLLREHGRTLILCRVSVPTKCIFTVAGLDGVFEFADNKYAAMEALQGVK
jgi:anti-anti-sigma regulatory factor